MGSKNRGFGQEVLLIGPSIKFDSFGMWRLYEKIEKTCQNMHTLLGEENHKNEHK